MRRVHWEATERVGANRLGQNGMLVVFIGRAWTDSQWKQGLAYHTTEETDLLHSEWGPIDQEGSGVPQNG